MSSTLPFKSLYKRLIRISIAVISFSVLKLQKEHTLIAASSFDTAINADVAASLQLPFRHRPSSLKFMITAGVKFPAAAHVKRVQHSVNLCARIWPAGTAPPA
jgi:hypothetical protein